MSSKSSWGITIRTIVFSIVLGGASGVLATALTSSYLSSYAVQLGELTTPLRLAEERPKAFPESFQEAIATTKENIFPGLAEFYPASEDGLITNTAVQRGAVLTSDGWILTLQNSEEIDLADLQVLVGRDVYKIDRAVVDEDLNIVFVKIEAENLPVLAFGNGFDLSAGDQVFVIPAKESVISTTLASIDFGGELSVSSDLPSRKILLQQKLNPNNLGAPVSNLSGELVGLVISLSDDNKTKVLPLNSVLPSFQTLLREDEVGRAKLGLNVVDLAHVYGLSDELTRGYEHGAFIMDEEGIETGAAASEADLQIGDIILSVNGQPINNQRTLDELIMDYSSEDKILLTVDRGGDMVDVEVVLK